MVLITNERLEELYQFGLPNGWKHADVQLILTDLRDARQENEKLQCSLAMAEDGWSYESKRNADLEAQLAEARRWASAWKLLAQLWHHMIREEYEGDSPEFQVCRDFVGHYYDEMGQSELAHRLCSAYGKRTADDR